MDKNITNKRLINTRTAPLLLASVLALAACQPAPTAPGSGQQSTASGADTLIGRNVRATADKARAGLEHKNMTISRKGLPDAAITPAGDLLVDGKPVAISDAQRQLLLAHRQQLVAIADAGIDMGVAGANLGLRAAGHAIRGVLKGEQGDTEAAIEAEAQEMENAAQALCEQVKVMQASRRSLAVQLPALAPYAGENEDNDCRSQVSIRRS